MHLKGYLKYRPLTNLTLHEFPSMPTMATKQWLQLQVEVDNEILREGSLFMVGGGGRGGGLRLWYLKLKQYNKNDPPLCINKKNWNPLNNV